MRYVLKAAILWSTAALVHVFARDAFAAGALADPASRPALAIRSLRQAPIISSGHAGTRLVAVGERGLIIFSDDGGKRWKQAPSPVSVTLTAVKFVNELEGWITGHAGVVLHSADGGQTWMKQLDGVQALALLRDTAAAADGLSDSSDIEARTIRTRQFLADGADKPFLDLYFSDKAKGMVVGAYGIAFATEDGGRSWKPAMDRFANPKGLHLYSIAGYQGRMYVAGEQGSFFRSSDNGAHFTRQETGYRGSFFTVSWLPNDTVLLAGLRGNVFRSGDGGLNWKKVPINTASAIVGTIHTADERLLVADDAGHLFESGDNGQSFSARNSGVPFPTSTLLETRNKEILIFGMSGVGPATGVTQDSHLTLDKAIQ